MSVRNYLRVEELETLIPYSCQRHPKLKCIRVPNNITDLSIDIKDNDLLLPTKCNFPAIDALLAPHVLFQYPPNHIIPLVFVVPSEIYDNFKYQNYKVPKRNLADYLTPLKDAERMPRELHNVQQMAMKVDLMQIHDS